MASVNSSKVLPTASHVTIQASQQNETITPENDDVGVWGSRAKTVFIEIVQLFYVVKALFGTYIHTQASEYKLHGLTQLTAHSSG